MAPCRDAKSACLFPRRRSASGSAAGCSTWYRKHGRDLPWRETRDPYRILVSEVMLQQTQVDRVLPKYHEWLRPLSDVRGARRRARSRRRRAPGTRSATTSGRGGCTRSRARPSTSYGGALPDDEATLRSFKGIGAYTAGAVMSFAFGKRAAILDTNVARVLFRVFVGRGDAAQPRDGEAPLGRLAGRAAPPARLRLQPGADGFRRDGLHARASRECLMLSDDVEVPRLSLQPRP